MRGPNERMVSDKKQSGSIDKLFTEVLRSAIYSNGEVMEEASQSTKTKLRKVERWDLIQRSWTFGIERVTQSKNSGKVKWRGIWRVRERGVCRSGQTPGEP